MRDLYVIAIYMAFLVIGCTAPFVFSLGYLWVDTFYPQYVARSMLRDIPVAEIMAIATLGGYLLMDRRNPPRLTLTTVLVVTMAVWVTLTSTWAVAPGPAWFKWDTAFKSILFSAFLPYVLRSRVQIESFIQVYIFAAAIHILPVAAKTLVSGGHVQYGEDLGILGGNLGLSESSTLSAVSIMFIPILLSLRSHALLIASPRWRTLIYGGYVVAAVFGALGTFARTALIGFAVAGFNMWLQARRKALTGAVMLAALLVVGALTTSAWNSRISTITEYAGENSAYVRILVWKWTLGFAQSHPLGGGFNSFYVNTIDIPGNGYDIPDTIEHGRAFHSVFFEMLGEHGYPGLLLFLGIVAAALWSYTATRRRSRGVPELAWCHSLAGALRTALLTLLACGAFIGIGFQPMLWYLFALSISLREYVRRCEMQGESDTWASRQVKAVPSRLGALTAST